ncbi:DUF4474 domain-containing protein [Vallitalea guaymasensis]|uniref:DUF4474 domain-containing protein n=1 Tax=Vallitalea guaymasensis TaxID=1185412 RepID=UPI000DE1D245|nr:DUF4474 domain-containing protein [Vallitalea guaymasensis]
MGNFKIGTYSKLEHYYDEDKINKFNPFMYIDPSGYFKEKEFFYIGKTPYVHRVIDCQNIIDCKSFEESNEDKFDLFNIDPKDVTRDAARWLIGNPVNAFITQHPYLTGFLTGVPIADIFYAAGFVMDDDGVYHARPDCLQQLGGYNDFYDIIFDYATSMKKDKFEFSSGGKDYIFWAWKGDYLNLGAGAELGIYSHDSGILGLVDITTPYDEHWLVDTNLSMPMTITLKYKGETIISYDPSKDKDNPYEKVWWITGFNPYEQGVQASELTATYTVSFKGNETMFIDFAKKYDLVDDRWDFDYDNFSATLNF